MKKLKSFIKDNKDVIVFVLGFLGTIYGLSATFAFPILQVQYGAQHGFWMWLFGGEFVALLQAIAWPFYVPEELAMYCFTAGYLGSFVLVGIVVLLMEL